MANIGRFICVAMPFALTIASLIALLTAALAGVTDKGLYNFKVTTANLSISTSDITSLLESKRDLGLHQSNSESMGSAATTTTSDVESGISGLISTASAAAASATSAADLASDVAGLLSSTNITAADLGLADAYYINLWNYCAVDSNGTTACQKSQFDWASNATSEFETTYASVISSAGGNDSIPDSLKNGLNTFAVVTKWTEITFLIAFAALALTLAFGVFATCSKAISCCAWITAAFAVIAVGAAASLATGMASVVVGLAEGSAKIYGVTAAFNTRFMASVWISFAFILAAAVFWLASVCCCSPDRRSARSGGSAFGARNVGKNYENSSYVPLQENNASAYTGAGAAQMHGGAGDSYYHAGDGAKYENYRSHK